MVTFNEAGGSSLGAACDHSPGVCVRGRSPGPLTKRPATRSKKKSALMPAAKPAKAKSSSRRDDDKPPAAKAASKAPAKEAPVKETKAPKDGKDAKDGKKPTARSSKKEPAPPPPPRPEYTLDGPTPTEGAGLPKKVGALLGIE